MLCDCYVADKILGSLGCVRHQAASGCIYRLLLRRREAQHVCLFSHAVWHQANAGYFLLTLTIRQSHLKSKVQVFHTIGIAPVRGTSIGCRDCIMASCNAII